MNRLGKMMIRLVMLGSCMLLLLSTVVTAAVDPHTSYIGDNADYSTTVPLVKPQWTYEMDGPVGDYDMSDGLAATGEGKVFYITNGQMIAVNSATGKRLWKYGGKLKGPILYKDGRVYVSTDTGYIHAVNAASGKKIWANTVANPYIKDMIVEGDQLIILNMTIQAFSLKDGKKQWSSGGYNEILMGEEIRIVDDMILTENWENGGIFSHSVLLAFNRKTGKLAWNMYDHRFPIDAKNGTILSQLIRTEGDKNALTTLDTIELKTGKIIKTVKFNPLNVDPDDENYGNSGIAWMKDGIVYINIGSSVYSYLENGDGAKASKKSEVPQQFFGGMPYAAGPHDGKMIFTDGREITGVKLVNNGSVSYGKELSGPIARFDLIGHGMYVAGIDGTMLAINLATTKSISRFQTGGRAFGPTLEENGMIIVQTKGKLLAFKEPKGLKAE